MQQEETKPLKRRERAIRREKWQDCQKGGEKNNEFAKAGKPPDRSFYCCQVPGLQEENSYP